MVTEVCKIGRAFARGQTLSKKTNVETTRWQSATGGAPALAGAPIPRVTREATAAEPEVRSTKMMRLLVGFWDSGVPWYPAFLQRPHIDNPYQAAQAPVALRNFPEIVAKSGPERDCIGSGEP